MARVRKFTIGDTVRVNRAARRDFRHRSGIVIDVGPEKGYYRVAFSDGTPTHVGDLASFHLDAVGGHDQQPEPRIDTSANSSAEP